MNQRELSERLEELANQLETWMNNDEASERIVYEVMQELRKLSTENYAPGSSLSWDTVKPKPVKKPGGFISKSGKKLPF